MTDRTETGIVLQREYTNVERPLSRTISVDATHNRYEVALHRDHWALLSDAPLIRVRTYTSGNGGRTWEEGAGATFAGGEQIDRFGTLRTKSFVGGSFPEEAGRERLVRVEYEPLSGCTIQSDMDLRD